MTSKYRTLSSWGTALIPGTLDPNKYAVELHFKEKRIEAYGSAISRSVSLTIRFGKVILKKVLIGLPWNGPWRGGNRKAEEGVQASVLRRRSGSEI